MAVGFFGLSVYCVVAHRWPWVAIVAIFASLLAGLSPRMKGRFGLKAGEASLGGEFEDPFAGLTPAERDEHWEMGPAPDRQVLPPRTGSGED